MNLFTRTVDSMKQRNEVLLWKWNKDEPEKTPYLISGSELPKFIRLISIQSSSYFRLIDVSIKGKKIYHETFDKPFGVPTHDIQR